MMKWRKDKYGKCIVYVIITAHNRKSYIDTGISVLPDKFVNGHVKPTNLDIILQTKFEEYNVEFNKLLTSFNTRNLTSDEIKYKLLKSTNQLEQKEPLVLQYLDKAIREHDKPSSSRSYITLKHSLGMYCDLETLKFKEVDYEWLAGYNNFLIKRHNKPSTRLHRFTLLKYLFHNAQDDGFQVPMFFRKIKIKRNETMKRSLSVDELRSIRDAKLDENLSMWRDLFMLLFYLRGMNMADLWKATKIKNGRLDYIRSKTGRHLSVKIEPEAQTIINRYRGAKKLLKPCETLALTTFECRFNLCLKKIRKGLTTYYSRHTWATIAANTDQPIEAIAMALGHHEAYKTTQIYIDYAQKKVDAVNRTVIDFVNDNHSTQ